MAIFNVSILGTGVALPRSIMSDEDIDRKFDRCQGWSLQKYGIAQRYIAQDPEETTSHLAAKALREALAAANLSAKGLGLIICADSYPEQPIPNTSSLVHAALGLEGSGVATLDVNTTCLSFVNAFQVAAHFLHIGTYQHIGIVSSEVGSKGLNWDDPDASILFGDGAAAAILARCQESDESKIMGMLFRTYSEGRQLCEIRAGGSRFNVLNPPQDFKDYLFRMNGKGVFKLASQTMPQFFEDIFALANTKLEDIDWVIPHQASVLAIAHLQQRLRVPSDKMINILASYGNQISASIPTALHVAISSGKLQRGQNAMLIGTSAGMSLGSIVFRY
jgi:3-oxoacyl-[acyl-carrier-protein] synthase-3